MIVSASIIISVSLTVCCLVSQDQILENIEKMNHVYRKGVVASDNENCSIIGAKILKENGSAVDAAVATSFCLGVVNMHSSGIGGGGVMIVYKPEKNQSVLDINYQTIVYDYREVVPRKLPDLLNDTQAKDLSMGGLSIAVPGEVAGLYMAWKDHGKLPWKKLVEPAIKLAREGFLFHHRIWEASTFMKSFIEADYGLSELLLVNDSVREMNTVLVNEKLALTLEKIAEDPMSFYTGDLSHAVTDDVINASGVFEIDDLAKYEVKRRFTIDLKLKDGFIIKAAPPPLGGIVVETILNILQGYNFSIDDLGTDEKAAYTYHRIIEAMKFGFAKRTMLGDPEFMNQTFLADLLTKLRDPQYGEQLRGRILNFTQNQDYYEPEFFGKNNQGTTHVSIMAPDGSAVSMTSSINIWFGSGYRSPKTGIIYNNHIDDFSIQNRTNAFLLKPSPKNNIEAYKRPLSSMSPIIIMKDGDLKMIVGGSGGTRIISSVTSVIMYKLWFNKTLSDSVTERRLHHQLTPNKVVMEKKFSFPETIIDLLKTKYGHIIGFTSLPEYSSVQAIYIENNNIYGKSDPRKGGVEAGF